MIMRERELRVLVTGGSGFIGQHLLNTLSAHTPHLFALRSKATVTDLPNANVQWLQGDLASSSDVGTAVEQADPDIVIHLAAHGVTTPTKAAAEAVRVNVTGTVNLYDALQSSRVQRIVHVGTGYQYGAQAMPVAETAPLMPENIYATTKASADLLAALYSQDAGLPIVRLRLFPVFGPGQSGTTFIANLIRKLNAKDPIALTPGHQVRDYLFIDDAVRALIAAAFSPEDLGGCAINIGGGVPLSLRELSVLIAPDPVQQRRLQWGALPYRPGELMALWSNIEKARHLLHWQPTVSLETGIDRVRQYLSGVDLAQNRAA